MISPQKANTRNPAQRERDRAYLAERYLRGVTQAEIAVHLGLSRQQITYDVKLLQARWRQSSLHDFDAARGQELAKIDELERTYWVAWEHSLQERQTTTTKRVDVGVPGEQGGSARAEAQLRKEQRDGNPAYLEGVRWCIERRCRLLGLDAPEQIEHSGGVEILVRRVSGRSEDDDSHGSGTASDQ